MLKTAASSLRDSIVQVVFKSSAGLLSFVFCLLSFVFCLLSVANNLLSTMWIGGGSKSLWPPSKKRLNQKERKESCLKCGESISARECFPSGWIVGYIGFLPKLPPISSKLRIRTTFCFAIAGIWTTVCRFKVVEIALKLLHIRCD